MGTGLEWIPLAIAAAGTTAGVVIQAQNNGADATPTPPKSTDPTKLDPVESARRERELRRIATLRDQSSLIVPNQSGGPRNTGSGLYVPPPIQ